MKNKIFRIIVIAGILLLVGCVPPSGPVVLTSSPKENQSFSVTTFRLADGYLAQRFVDTEAGIVCYTVTSPGGMSCLPISETRLDQ